MQLGSDQPLLTYEVSRSSVRVLCGGRDADSRSARSRRETAGVQRSPHPPPDLLLIAEDLTAAPDGVAGPREDTVAPIGAVLHRGSTAPPVRVVRKGDHRAFYWDYSGPVSQGRGRIRELLRGRLVGLGAFPEPPAVLALRWASENPGRT